jgi:membrane-associated phospholipid phosphatase
MRKLAALVMLTAITGLRAKSQNLNSIVPAIGAPDTLREISITPTAAVRPDTVPRFSWNQGLPAYKNAFPYKSFILPAAMVAYGFTALKVGALKNLNGEVKEEMWIDNPHSRFHADNYLMYVPALAVYGLNAAGIHGAHNFKDRTMILLMTQLFAQGTVFSLKSMTHTLRPDGSAYNSFPSGHTAEAFANAEFMRMEYKDVSPWYGVAGYAVATATGMLRMYNNKHWMNDVVAGAGIGIASARLSYWLYPKIQHLLFKDKSPGTVIMPSYNNGSIGLSFAHHF